MNDKKDSITDISEAFAPIVRFLEGIFKWIEDNSETIAKAANKFHQHVLFEQSGWLPHYTTPFGLMEDIVDAHSLANLLERYYIDNWSKVKHEFRMHVAEMHVDEEAKDTFYEALEAHEHGLYRTTARTLFPEIERLARGSAQHNGSLPNIASLVEIRRAAGNLGLSELSPPEGGPVLAHFARMSHHIYEHARTSEAVVILASDPVPNRHATIHGLISYKTMQSSLNSLIMTEFMYRIVSLTNRL